MLQLESQAPQTTVLEQRLDYLVLPPFERLAGKHYFHNLDCDMLQTKHGGNGPASRRIDVANLHRSDEPEQLPLGSSICSVCPIIITGWIIENENFALRPDLDGFVEILLADEQMSQECSREGSTL